MEGQMPLVGPLWVSNKHGRSIEHCFIFIFFQYKGRWNWNIFTLLFNFWRAIFYLKKKKRNFFGVWFVAVLLIWFLRCNDLWDVIYEIIKWGWSAIWSIADRFSIKIGSHWFFSSSPLGGTCNCVSAFQVTWECDPPIVFEQKVNHKVRVGVGAEMDFHFFGAKRKKMNDNRGQVNNSWEIENCETQKKKRKKLRGKREKREYQHRRWEQRPLVIKCLSLCLCAFIFFVRCFHRLLLVESCLLVSLFVIRERQLLVGGKKKNASSRPIG